MKTTLSPQKSLTAHMQPLGLTLAMSGIDTGVCPANTASNFKNTQSSNVAMLLIPVDVS